MAFCTQCAAQLENGAAFCSNCGARAAAPPTPNPATPAAPRPTGFVAPGGGTQVCTHCGIIAPLERTFCSVCDARFDERKAAPDRPDGSYWVAVEARFDCRSCGQSAPLNHLDVDGAVKCMHCGVEQRFDAERWTQALAAAHAVGDLAGPDPEGRNPGSGSVAHVNPYAGIGRSDTLISVDLAPLRIRAAPGHPLCDTCHSVVRITNRTNQLLSTHCPGCHAQRQYEMPAAAQGRFRGVIGVLGVEHEKGRNDVTTEAAAGGAVVIKCPHCTAPLNLPENLSFATCQYCGSACRITPEAMWRAGMKTLRAEWWWLLLQGPSEQRERLRAPQAQVRHVQKQLLQQKARAKKGAGCGVAVTAMIGVGVAAAAVFMANAPQTGSGGGSVLKNPLAALTSDQWSGIDRAALVDVNGDGVMDVVGRLRRLQPNDSIFVALLNGKDGSTLWQSESVGSYSDLIRTPLAVTSDTVVIATKTGHLSGFTLKDGTPRWQIRLSEVAERVCSAENPSQLFLDTKDKKRHLLELASGSVSAAGTWERNTECVPVLSDSEDAQPGTLHYEWSNEYAEFLPRDKFAGVAADEALHLVEPNLSIGLGHKNPGTRVPMLVAYRWSKTEVVQGRHRLKPTGKLEHLWSAQVPGVDPLQVREGEPDWEHVGASKDTVAVAYEGKDSHNFRITAFSLNDGRRLWDTQMESSRPLSGVMVSPTHVYVSRWSELHAFDAKSGKHLFTR